MCGTLCGLNLNLGSRPASLNAVFSLRVAKNVGSLFIASGTLAKVGLVITFYLITC
jgi:hypothetical protein